MLTWGALQALPPAMKEGMIQAHIAKVPVKHVGMPDEIAETYLFAMKCTYLTGQTIVVDGGAALV